MKVAIYFNDSIQSGGGFQQSLNAILAFKNQYDSDLIIATGCYENIEILEKYDIKSIYIKISKLRERLFESLYSGRTTRFLLKKLKIKHPFERALLNHDIDIVYFPGPSTLATYLTKLNFVFTVWDLCHRDHPEFPEVRDNFEFESREYVYQNTLNKAVAIVADSPLGKQNIIRRYNVDEERIIIIPFSPALSTSSITEDIDIKETYDIKGDYVFYPAQFWAHKNHAYILRAIHDLHKTSDHRISAVFSGGDKGNITFLKNLAKDLKVENWVKFVGFVPNEHIPLFYQSSLALVMPSYFGPTNLPPLEGFSLETPVICADFPGSREQIEDAGLFMDLKNPQSLAYHLKSLIEQPDLRKSLTVKGTKRLEVLSYETKTQPLLDVFKDFEIKLSSWK